MIVNTKAIIFCFVSFSSERIRDIITGINTEKAIILVTTLRFPPVRMQVYWYWQKYRRSMLRYTHRKTIAPCENTVVFSKESNYLEKIES